MKTFPFPRHERIKGLKKSSELFRSSQIINEFPFICKHLLNKNRKAGIEVLISIPKKRIHGAVDRNLLKRRTREAWRLNVANLRQATINKNINLNVGLYYQNNVILPYKDIEQKIILIINRLIKIYETTSS
ncbi:MAG: hypothetical protein GX259_10955 [Bacteroidales bacterium]|nr:hypothetical protein [Bacteroidales bacterium]